MIQDVSPVYKWIVDNVVTRTRPDFLQEGVDEKVLDELKARWEAKLVESGALDGEDGDYDDDDDGVRGAPAARAAPEAYHGASAGMAAARMGMPGGAPMAVYAPAAPMGSAVDPAAAAAAMATYVGQKRPLEGHVMTPGGQMMAPEEVVRRIKMANQAAGHPTIPQHDGAGDSDAGAEAAAPAAPSAQAGSSGRPAPEGEDKVDVDDTLGEALSNHESEDDDEAPEDIPNLVLAQFEKVQRTKSRWKCHMKQGIVQINGHEYVFAKAVGEYRFE